MVRILGISAFYHDSAACFIVNGEIFEKVLNAQSLLFVNSLKSRRLARFSVRRLGHTLLLAAGDLPEAAIDRLRTLGDYA